MAPERVAERRAALDVDLHVLEDDREVLVVGLGAEDVEALHDRKTGIDHRREEAREGHDVAEVDAGAESERAERAALLLDLRRHELLAAKARLDAGSSSASIVPFRSSPVRARASQTNSAIVDERLPMLSALGKVSARGWRVLSALRSLEAHPFAGLVGRARARGRRRRRRPGRVGRVGGAARR